MRERAFIRHPIRSRYFALRRAGFDERTAGNLTALELGLLPIPAGWTVDEIAALLFLKHRVGTDPSSRS